MRLVTSLLGLVAPAACAVCEGPLPRGMANGVCASCDGAFPGWLCHRVGGVAGRLACGPLDSALRHAIHRFKYGGEVWRASGLGHWMSQRCWPEGEGPEEGAVVVAIPMDAKRRRARGYNQAELLAQSFAFYSRRPLALGLLERVRTSGRLAGEGRETRRGVLGSYALTEERAPERVILVDDVTTTGSTLEACGEALRAGGVSTVHAICVAGADILAPHAGPLRAGTNAGSS